jgi:hypothetical protein
MEKTRAGRSLPAQSRLLLSKTSVPQTQTERTGINPFFPISPAIEDAICALARSSPRVSPEAILSRVLKQDAATRAALEGALGPYLFRGLEERLLLSRFSSTERTRLLLVRERFAKERSDESVKH